LTRAGISRFCREFTASAARYQVSLTAKGRISTFPHVKFAPVDVAEKGCARFNFTVDPFGSPEEQKSPNDAPHALEKGKDGEKSSGSAW